MRHKGGPPTTSVALNKLTNVYSFVLSDIDVLYDSFFESMRFETRKIIDYQFWAIVVRLHKLGYFY